MWNKDVSSGRKSLGNYRCLCDEWSDYENGIYRYTGENDFCSYGEKE